jgi:Ubiquitin carboxyl-terminal hydrolase
MRAVSAIEWLIDARLRLQCKDAITFPMTIDFTDMVHPVQGSTQRLNGDASGPSDATAPPERQSYELTAILLHRGSSASSGHYVSIVKDEQTGTWWKYDDEFVSDMGTHPFNGAQWDAGSGEQPAAEAAAVSKKGGAGKGGAAKGGAGKGGKRGAKGKGAKAEAKLEGDAAAADAARDADVMVVDGDAEAGEPDVQTLQPADGKGSRGAPRSRSTKRANSETAAAAPPAPKKPRGGAAPRGGAHRTKGEEAPEPMDVTETPPAAAVPAPDAVPEGSGAGQPEAAPAAQNAAEKPAAEALPQELCSKDAYMLIYTRSGCKFGSCVPREGAEQELPEAVRAHVLAMADERREAQHAAAARRLEQKVCGLCYKSA